MNTMECNICSKRGGGYWAGWPKDETGHNNFILLCGDKPYPEKHYLRTIRDDELRDAKEHN